MSDTKILQVGLSDIINGLPAELEKKNAELTALRARNEELEGALEAAADALKITGECLEDEPGWKATAQGIFNDEKAARTALERGEK